MNPCRTSVAYLAHIPNTISEISTKFIKYILLYDACCINNGAAYLLSFSAFFRIVKTSFFAYSIENSLQIKNSAKPLVDLTVCPGEDPFFLETFLSSVERKKGFVANIRNLYRFESTRIVLYGTYVRNQRV